MPKDNRAIHSAVRIGKTVFGPGMEDELTAAASAGQLDRLLEKGAISGDFKPVPEQKSVEADVVIDEAAPADKANGNPPNAPSKETPKRR